MKVLSSLLLALVAILGLIRQAQAGSDPAGPEKPGELERAEDRRRSEALNQAAGLYHQAQYESSRMRLESLLAEGPWRRTDSLLIFQYLGMSWSRLGQDSAALLRFQDLLGLDSLFRFPSNEDGGILRNFQAAREVRSSRLAASPTQTPPPPLPMALAESASASPGPAPEKPALALIAPPPEGPKMTLALGAVPLGGGWLVRQRKSHGLTLGLLQAGGLLISIYASERQTRAARDDYGTQASELNASIGWQWTQRVSLSTAVGAYLFSIIAAGGD